LWQNDATLTRVRWFKAPEGSPLVPQPNPFVSSIWDESRTSIQPQIGEQARVGYDREKGSNAEGYLGIRTCGPVDAWHNGGVHGKTPVITTDSFGVARCCPVAGQIGEGGAGAGGDGIFQQRALGGAGAGGSGFQAGPGYLIVSLPLYPYWVVIRAEPFYQIGEGGAGGGGPGIVIGPRYQVGVGGAGAGGFADLGNGVYFTGDYRWNFDSTAPAGWLLCDGSIQNIATYPTLGALLGSTFGGDGVTTFGLPDPRSCSLVAGGAGPGFTARNPGDSGGAETVLLTGNQSGVGTHNHASIHGLGFVENAVAGGGIVAGTPVAALQTSITTANAGPLPAASAHENMHPWICVGFLFVKT
jgi:microcystin-dependent protein